MSGSFLEFNHAFDIVAGVHANVSFDELPTVAEAFVQPWIMDKNLKGVGA